MVDFILTATLLAFLPGPDNLYLLNLSIKQGKKTAFAFLFGLCSGLIIHSFFALLGIGIVIVSNSALFFGLKVFGSIYLLYLAYGLLLHTKVPATQSTSHTTLKKHYLQGVVMNLSNPKVLLFFIAFLPQFINPEQNYALQIITLGAVFILCTFFVFLSFVLLGGAIASFLKNPLFLKWLHYLTAAFLAVAASRLVLT